MNYINVSYFIKQYRILPSQDDTEVDAGLDLGDEFDLGDGGDDDDQVC